MSTAHFIAQALCLYYIVTGIAMIVNSRRYIAIFNEISKNSSLILLSGVIALIIGILIILSHNVWTLSWPLLVTLVGWLAFFKGVCLLLFPDRFISWFSPLYTQARIGFLGYIVLLLGLIFGYLGF